MTDNVSIESLYPELAEHGALADVLNSLGSDSERPRFVSPAGGRLSARTSAGDSMVTLIAAAGNRVFVLSFVRAGREVAHGKTSDIRDVRGAVESWLNGVSLRQLGSRWPFVDHAEAGEAYERQDTGGVIEANWRALLDDVSPALRPVVEEARERPNLRAMFPVYSHQTFRVVKDPGKRWDTPHVRPRYPQGFQLVSPGEEGTVLAEGTACVVIDAYVRALDDA